MKKIIFKLTENVSILYKLLLGVTNTIYPGEAALLNGICINVDMTHFKFSCNPTNPLPQALGLGQKKIKVKLTWRFASFAILLKRPT